MLGIGSYFIIVDFPEDSPKSWNFLSVSEAAFVVARIEHDRSDTFVEPFNLRAFLKTALDSKIWAFAVLYMLTTTNSYSISYFLPIILRDGMGFSVAKAQCLVAPPYVAAAIVMYIQAHFSDKWRLRGPTIVGNALLGTTIVLHFGLSLQSLGVLGLGLLGYMEHAAVRYFGVFLATISCEWKQRRFLILLLIIFQGNANCPALLTYQRY